MDKGSIHIYCGEGKGKTTAAIGQGIQEASQGRSVIIIQFMKERNAEAIGFVQRLEPEIKLFRFQKAEEAFEDLPDAEKAEEIKNLKNALNFARKVLVTEDKIFDLVVKIRKNTAIPLVFMTYANVVFSYGTERFIKRAAEIGMDGLILPDVPFEEKEEFDRVCREYGL